MKYETIIERIKEFQNTYVFDYMIRFELSFCKDDMTGKTICEDGRGYIWEIPYSIFTRYGEKMVGIDIGCGEHLDLNGEGLYCFLWHEACSRIKRKD